MIRRLFSSFADRTPAHSTRNAAKGAYRRKTGPTRVRALRAFESLEPRALLAITVTTTADVVNPHDGEISLREAIQMGVDSPGDDVVQVPVARYRLSEGDLRILDLTGRLTIEGIGGVPVLVAAPEHRVFSIHTVSSVELRNLWITGGDASSGGGIRNGGDLTIVNSTVNRNQSFVGGGIVNLRTGVLNIIGSTISNNRAIGISGGGIVSSGHMTIVDSTISENSSGAEGGGIRTAFRSISAIVNSTISGNVAALGGGGIADAGTTLITNSTIVLNVAGTGRGSDAFVRAGGIHALGPSHTTLNNTIVAGNFSGRLLDLTPSDIREDENGPIDGSYNLIGDPRSSGRFVDGVNGTIVGRDGAVLPITEILDPVLSKNGGPTLTHALVLGSPAMNAGSNDLARGPDGEPLVTDQRGDGFPRISGGIVDIGSYEFQSLLADEIINVILQDVSIYFEIGLINIGQVNSLSRKLELKGNLGDLGRVFSFIREVHALSNAGILNEKEAVPLLSNAQLLLAELVNQFGQQIDPIFDEQPGEPSDDLGFQLASDLVG